MEQTKRILRELIGFDSTFDNEAAVGQHIRSLFEDKGYRIIEQEVPFYSPAKGGDKRHNYIIRRGEPRLYLCGHLDTVKPAGDGKLWTYPPFQAVEEEEEGRIYGLGAVDMKGGLAACLGAVLAADAEHVGLCLTCDEEGKFCGIRTLVKSGYFETHKPELMVFAEPTDLRIISSHRGCIEIEFHAVGQAAHAAMPELGRDACQLFTCLSALKLELLAEFPGTAFSIGYFEAGRRDSINVIPHQATGIIDVRPSAKLQQRGAAYIAARAAALVQQQDLALKHEVTIDMKPLAVEASQLGPLEQVLAEAELTIRYTELAGTSEAGEIHHRYGIPAVNFGPGPRAMSHQVDEYVETATLLKAREVFELLVRSYQR